MKNEYTEFMVEYDPENLVVYLSGLDKDLFWDELAVWDEVDNPENFAEGVKAALQEQGHTVQASVVEFTDD